MKKYILGLATMLAFTGFSQNIEITYEGEVVESPSDEMTGDADGDYVFKYYYVHNLTAGDLTFDWEREQLADMGCYEEQICTDENCYIPGSGTYESPESVTIPVGDSLLFKIGASADVNCCAVYRYRMFTGLGTSEDSIDLKIRLGGMDCFLGAEEDEQNAEISVYPNPANASFFVANVETKSSFVLYNLLGDVVVSNTLQQGTNEISTIDLPNGVYFYKIQNESGEVVETKKLVIKH